MRGSWWFRPLTAMLLAQLMACYTYQAAPLSPTQPDAERTRPLRVKYVRGQRVEGLAVADEIAAVTRVEHWVAGDTLWGIRAGRQPRTAADTTAIPLADVREARGQHLHVGNTVVSAVAGVLVVGLVVGLVATAVAVSQMGPVLGGF